MWRPSRARPTGPGEVAGPAVRFTLRLRNDSAQEVPLNTTVVNLYYGKAKTPASPLSEPGGAPLPATVAAGGEASGTYVFVVPQKGPKPGPDHRRLLSRGVLGGVPRVGPALSRWRVCPARGGGPPRAGQAGGCRRLGRLRQPALVRGRSRGWRPPDAPPVGRARWSPSRTDTRRAPRLAAPVVRWESLAYRAAVSARTGHPAVGGARGTSAASRSARAGRLGRRLTYMRYFPRSQCSDTHPRGYQGEQYR